MIGDMDSLSDEDRARLEARGCRFVEHPRAKDETDLELALTYAVQEGAREIVILGALGGRLDHLLANLAAAGLARAGRASRCASPWAAGGGDAGPRRRRAVSWQGNQAIWSRCCRWAATPEA